MRGIKFTLSLWSPPPTRPHFKRVWVRKLRSARPLAKGTMPVGCLRKASSTICAFAELCVCVCVSDLGFGPLKLVVSLYSGTTWNPPETSSCLLPDYCMSTDPQSFRNHKQTRLCLYFCFLREACQQPPVQIPSKTKQHPPSAHSFQARTDSSSRSSSKPWVLTCSTETPGRSLETRGRWFSFWFPTQKPKKKKEGTVPSKKIIRRRTPLRGGEPHVGVQIPA